MQFSTFKSAVAQQFKKMSSHELFTVAVDKDDLWACYLSSFPPGTNPVFRERTEHDCSCCRSFVRTVGVVVAVIDGKLTSIWDIAVDEPAYQAVADALSTLVKSKPIENVFLHTERAAGVDKTFENAVAGVKTWDHFHVNTPAGALGQKNFVCPGAQIGPRLSETRALHDVLLRSLNEITDDAIATVLDLIAQNSLYRGEEHRHAVNAFQQVKRDFAMVAPGGVDGFVWSRVREVPPSVSKIRNTSIGTLLVDLSTGRDMDAAVGAFEAMVAPVNYKRPTALVTPAMVEKAKATLAELGLTSALERRYATLADVSVDNILFADRGARKAMTGDVFDDIASAMPVKSKRLDKVEEVPVDKFLADILPRAESIEVLVENRHQGNLVSLVAPVDPTAGKLFKWDNLFSWSYVGDVADSIKERVKQAGGNVTGEFCCRLAWHNFDDLDLHMVEPNGWEIYFGEKGPSPGGGRLDVDMNAGSGRTREPVENIFYASTAKMREGTYRLAVRNFAKRETTNVGFDVEVDFRGVVHRFACDRAVGNRDVVDVAEFRYSHAGGLEIVKSLPLSTASRKVWGVDTETFRRATVVMLSPNHWDGHGVGNRHYFFMLDGCQNDGQARGFYNEFLAGALDPHRKVFELVGSRMRTDEAVEQLSGLGFSSTQRNSLLVRVQGAFGRTVRVLF